VETKGLVLKLAESFSKIFDGKIVINAVAASPVETDMLDVIPIERREAFLKTVITKRFAKPQEVAKTIVWLATESPEYINGTCIDINNGSFPR
jgi:3-oxoacyl-[acyl-carrier protein] reductase